MGEPELAPPKPVRLESVDAFRGLVMLLMLGSVLGLAQVAKSFPENDFWAVLAHHQTHVEWVGCSLHDLIQPAFSLLVGVSLPYSLAARRSRGHSDAVLTLHAIWRAFLLIAIGIFLESYYAPLASYGFIGTLCQIGLGYPFLFLLAFTSVRVQWLVFVVILVGYWAWFAAAPLPGPDYDWAAVGVTPAWFEQNGLSGFAAHWNKNANPGHEFNVWFSNLFPREKPFVFNSGGYVVTNAIPTLATMILGLIAGGVLKSERSDWAKVRWFVIAGLIGLIAGYALGWFGVCPVVKRIWTPSWVLFSGGWTYLILAGFYASVDVLKFRWWVFPLVVVGMNSIAAYCMSSLVKPIVHRTWNAFFGEKAAQAAGFEHGLFQQFGPEYEPLLHGAATLFGLWLILYWMYRQKIFIKV